jgi:nucleotide-binding universal stress UspA family protein
VNGPAVTRPVLLCFDGSEGSRHAIAVASALGIGGRAVVCHSWAGFSHAVFRGNLGLVPAPLGEAIDEIDELDRRAAEELAREGASLAAAAGFDAVPAAVKQETKAWRALLAAAVERHAGLIVIGAHGRSGAERLLLGSVSSAVLTHAHTPVLVVPEAAKEESGGPVVVCFDGSEGARRALELAAVLLPGRRALVVSVWESWVSKAASLVAGVGPVHGMEVELDEIAAEQSQATAAAGAELADQLGLVAEPLAAKAQGGPVWRELLDTAAEHDAAAIVMGARGLTGISKALGSVSHGVVNHSRLPVLVVPSAT